MGLMNAEKMLRRDAHLLRHPPAILRDIGGIVARADAAIQACVNAVGHTAVAGEESGTQAGNGREQRRCQLHGSSAPAACFSSANPASVVRLGSEIASTLNIDPMPPRPPPISRFSAPDMSSETSWLALPSRLTARVSSPNRLRKSPCSTAP